MAFLHRARLFVNDLLSLFGFAINCGLWHEVDKSYEIEKVPPEARDGIVKQLAVLNLERTQCIDEIDRQLRAAVEQLQSEAIKH